MIIETVFLAADRFRWKSGWFSFPADKFAAYVCENVWISRLEMSAKEQPGGKVRVRLRTTLENRPGHDKWVKLSFRVKNGATEAAKIETAPISVEEHKHKTRTVEVVVPAEQLQTSPMTSLEITVTVWDD